MPVVTELSADIDLCAEYVERRCGMSFNSRRRVFASSIQERTQARGLRTPLDYYQYLTTHPTDTIEWTALFTLLLNGETRFFRDSAAFRALERSILPELRTNRRSARTGRKLRLWSAGCSTGQEAYSLAIIGRENTIGEEYRTEVLGTDVSQIHLQRAIAGRYRPLEISGLLDRHQRSYFTTVGNDLLAADHLKADLKFQTLDLKASAYNVPQQDVIFCQNVLIYYTPAARVEIVRKLCETVAPGGYLFLGAAEGVGLLTPGLELVRLDEAWAYHRREDSSHRDTREGMRSP
jgi:chemotaxis methyl-accepting protein methylase